MINVGVLGGADIAFKRFLPAVRKIDGLECVGVASKTASRRDRFFDSFQVPVLASYEELLKDPGVDIVYIPLPPVLHYKWTKKALEHGKHVIIEKPSTTSYEDTCKLHDTASAKGLALQENYMFQHHSQLQYIRNIIKNGRLGHIHLIKSSFGFPRRSENDFRYNQELGGGALLDVGGYIVKLASIMLERSIRLTAACSNFCHQTGVDIFGTVSFIDSNKLVYQGSYGIDCSYQCSLEIWGSKGRLYTNRIYTAPPDHVPLVTIEDHSGSETLELKRDDHFASSIEYFLKILNDIDSREKIYADLLKQAWLVDEVRKMGFGS